MLYKILNVCKRENKKNFIYHLIKRKKLRTKLILYERKAPHDEYNIFSVTFKIFLDTCCSVVREAAACNADIP